MNHPHIRAREIAQALNDQPGVKQILLSDEQESVVEAPLAPTLVVAGAGSGKTETMSLRVLYLLCQGMDPERILGLTFTRKAAGELSARLRLRIEQLIRTGLITPQTDTAWFAGSLNVSTYNAFASNVVKEYGLLLGVDPGAQLITDALKWQIMDEVLSHYTQQLPRLSRNSLIELALKLSDAMAEHAVSVADMRQYCAATIASIEEAPPSGRTKNPNPSFTKPYLETVRRQVQLLGLVEEYRRQKRVRQMIDFSDQMSYARQIVEQHPQVVDTLRGDYDAVLLDEFQDTSVGQLELLSRLFKDKPVMAVGDPNQAIYGFRGASAASLETFLEYFDTRGQGVRRYMTYAWRNDPKILDLANTISGANKQTDGTVKPLRSPKPEGGNVQYLYTQWQEDEYELVAQIIGQWKREDPTASIGVLGRKSGSLEPMLEACRTHHIPAVVTGMGGLLTQPVVADLRAVLKLSVDPTHGPSAMRLLANLDLAASDLRVLYEYAKHQRKRRRAPEDSSRTEFLADAIDSPPPAGWRARGDVFSEEASERVLDLARRLEHVREHMDRPLPTLVTTALHIFDLDIAIKSDPLTNAGMQAVDAFVDTVNDYVSQTQQASLRAFLDWIDVALEAERGLPAPSPTVDPTTVQIMTVHQAKGLEWDRVVVLDLMHGSFPSVDQAHNYKLATQARLDKHFQLKPRAQKGWMSDAGELPFELRMDRCKLDNTPILPLLPGLGSLDVREQKDVIEQYQYELAEYLEREERRIAYVAFTRPRTHLLLAGAWRKADAKSLQNPSLYLVEALASETASSYPDLCDDLPAVVIEPDEDATQPPKRASHMFPRKPGPARELITAGAERTREQVMRVHTGELSFNNLDLDPSNKDEAQLVAQVQSAIAHQRAKQKPADLTVDLSRLSATTMPQLLESTTEFALQLRRPLPQEPSDSAQLGTVFHEWAAQWAHLPAPLPETAEGLIQDDPDTVGEFETNPAFEALTEKQHEQLRVYQDRAIALFGDHPGFEAVETPFSVQFAALTVRGRIDALTTTAGKPHVIDWKTGAPPTRKRLGRAAQYATQLEVYRHAVAQERGIPTADVYAELVFLGGKTSLQNRRVSLAQLLELLPDYDFEKQLAQLSERERA
ncbi:ATP-dependent DNA helicase [Gleimia hominis]|uniref:DNA 3'-5' helicase n=1 Tax=Gleimia hominis TaxID=595468 RepID=A0ABU3IAB0_9ACTO|nr:ATP-dependent DNA helicase [Gleimia hominis]MDT3767310.1 ATP-dependent DNA helicase [Gleimia hominis]